MEFRRELYVKPFKKQLSIRDKVLLIGSCFSENLGEKLRTFKFDVHINPQGNLFNPISIVSALQSYIDLKVYTQDDLFFHDELWKSWDHHSQYADLDATRLLDRLNEISKQAHTFIKQANWVIITLGSAWVYERESGAIVANCHKVPIHQFNKRLLAVQEIKNALIQMQHNLNGINPDLHIIYTISPVRHLRDGFIENNRSKAILIQAVHELIEEQNQLFYFPAFELVVDDLRDYRFYDIDMVHPNYLATHYVWEKFQQACIQEESRMYFDEILKLQSALAHKPFQPETLAHKQFRAKQVERIQKLKAALPELNWQLELDFFID